MNEFVEECRQEWRRLGVEEAVANEMAADLTADLDEVAAEGGSAEDVLGNGAFDPRQFAADWAFARGVTAPPVPDRAPRWRSPVAVALTGALAVLTVVAGVFIAVGGQSRSIAVAVRRFAVRPAPIPFPVPGRAHVVIRGPFGPPFGATQITDVGAHAVAFVLLALGVVGLGLLFALYWLPRSVRRRDEHRGGPRSPGWN